MKRCDKCRAAGWVAASALFSLHFFGLCLVADHFPVVIGLLGEFISRRGS